HDGDDPDVFAHTRHARAQAADAPHDQVDLHPRRRRTVQRLDHVGIYQRVHLGHDPTLASLPRVLGLPRDGLQQARLHPARGYHQLAVARGDGKAGQHVEQVGQVGAQLWVGTEQAEVGVEPGGAGVVVAGADVDVTADRVALAPHDQQHLAVGLETGIAVTHVHADVL